MKGYLILFGILFFSALTFAQENVVPPVNDNDLPNFHEVVAGAIYRGAQPSNAGFAYLALNGIKTVIDLRNEKKLIAAESQTITQLKMKFISVPMSGFFAPKDKDVTNVQQILNNPEMLPVFVHCQYGEDRTGVEIGLYRVFTQHEAPKDAYQEMEKLGFHPALIFMKHYFDEKVGL